MSWCKKGKCLRIKNKIKTFVSLTVCRPKNDLTEGTSYCPGRD